MKKRKFRNRLHSPAGGNIGNIPYIVEMKKFLSSLVLSEDKEESLESELIAAQREFDNFHIATGDVGSSFYTDVWEIAEVLLNGIALTNNKSDPMKETLENILATRNEYKYKASEKINKINDTFDISSEAALVLERFEKRNKEYDVTPVAAMNSALRKCFCYKILDFAKKYPEFEGRE